MHRRESDGLAYYQFEGVSTPHGIFTRLGGTSSGHLSSLNVGATVGDHAANVAANRERMMAALSLDAAARRTVWQIHSARVLVANGQASAREGEPPPKADAIVTDRPGVGLEMRFADCVPVVLYDTRRGVIGLAHAGWRGTVEGIVPATVRAMQETFGCQPGDIEAGIGPSICAEHYPVGPEVVASIADHFGDTDGLVWTGDDGQTRLDLWAANTRALRESGVTKVEVGSLCTACNPHEFFSHRAEKGHTGRFGAVVALPS